MRVIQGNIVDISSISASDVGVDVIVGNGALAEEEPRLLGADFFPLVGWDD